MIARENTPSQSWPAKDRLTGAALALLLQIGFIAAFLHALPLMAPPKQLEHELTFFLPRLAPQTIPRSTPLKTEPTLSAPTLPVLIPPPLFSLPAPSAPSASAPPAAVQNFGRALFGCAPENYANLTPQQKAGCPRPGEGVAIQEAPPLDMRGHAKDEAYWQEQYRIKHLPMPDCLPSGSWMECEFAQAHKEIAREKQTAKELAYQKEKALQPPPPPVPPNIGAHPP